MPHAPIRRSAVLALSALIALGAQGHGPANAQTPAAPAAPAALAPAPLPAPPLNEVETQVLRMFVATAPGNGLPDAGPAGLSGDALITRAVELAQALHGQRIANPRAIESNWGYRPEPYDARAALEAARASNTLLAWTISQAPSHPAYAALVSARLRYARLAEAGGWAPLAVSRPLKTGDTDPAVIALRERLTIEGYAPVPVPPAPAPAPPPPAAPLAAPPGAPAAPPAAPSAPPEPNPALFDTGVADALKAWQRDHGVSADGVLGRAAVTALNITAAQRLAQIDLNLERERWLPRGQAADRIEVNIAAAELVLFRGGAPSLTMRAVVGKPSTPTPIFAAEVERVVLNPPWNVPGSIAAAELLPKGEAYLAANHYSFIDGRLVQAPGPGSALGVVKFDFNSPYGVYLHDTPAKAGFGLEVRYLSHGCMRLQKPRELAYALLAPQGVTQAQIEAIIARRDTRVIPLAAKLPVIVVYRTVSVAPDGRVLFHRDPYNWDAKLAAALRR
ncbi:MAG: L,D-transpeptidase family protein [Caulobacteraceae bacterium]